MAFPIVQATANSSTGSVTSHAVTMPSGITAGDILVAFFVCSGGVTISSHSGWTLEANVLSRASTNRLLIVSKVAAGSDTLTVVTSSGTQAAHAVYRIKSDSADVEVTTFSSTTATANPNPPSLTPTGGSDDYLWIAAVASGGVTVSAYPTNYSSNQVTNAAGAYTIGAATYNKTGTSEDPGTFTISSSADTVAATVSIDGQIPISASFPIITETSTIFQPAIDYGADGTFPIITQSSTIFVPTTYADQSANWTNTSRNTSTWTNL